LEAGGELLRTNVRSGSFFLRHWERFGRLRNAPETSGDRIQSNGSRPKCLRLANALRGHFHWPLFGECKAGRQMQTPAMTLDKPQQVGDCFPTIVRHEFFEDLSQDLVHGAGGKVENSRDLSVG